MTFFQAALNEKFADLPVIRLKPTMTDDDIEFMSDMRYLKDLLNSLVYQAGMGGRCNPWPEDLSYHFAWLEDQVAHD